MPSHPDTRPPHSGARSLALLPLLVAVACTGKDPTDETGETSEPVWENRWLQTFTAYLAAGTVEDAFAACEGINDATGSAWSGTPVFTLELSTNGTFVPHTSSTALATIEQDERGRYCRIEPLSDGAFALADNEWTSLVDVLSEQNGIAMPDLPTVVPMGLVDSASDTLTLVGSNSALLSSMANPLVNVVVADTEPTGTYSPTTTASTEHGGATARIVYSLLCETGSGGTTNDSSDCGVKVTTQHAMPYTLETTAQRSIIDGSSGQYGTHHSLAQAIDRATRAYVDNPEPTILNLSLGWNAGYAVDFDYVALTSLTAAERRAYMRAPSADDDAVLASWERSRDEVNATERVVYEALVRARCAGIIPIAASGNRTNLPTPEARVQDGPLLPAGWMAHENPATADTCAEHGYTNTGWSPGTPLVYAASGVDQQGRPLGLGRPASTSPLAALGLAVTVPDSTLPDEPYHLVSGTSASAAVTTAAVAAAWAMAPGLTGDDILTAVYNSGTPALDPGGAASVTADFGNLKGSTAQQIVQVCAAAQAVSTIDLGCPATSVTLASTGSVGSVSAAPVAPLDCETNPTTAPCGARYAPTPEALRDVWPQPPTSSCPPCQLEIVSSPTANLEAVFTFKTPDATPFWQKPTFTASNDIDAAYLELRPLVGQPVVLSYPTAPPPAGSPLDAPATELEVALNTPLNVYSATLVLEGSNTITGREKSWNVPLPITSP